MIILPSCPGDRAWLRRPGTGSFPLCAAKLPDSRAHPSTGIDKSKDVYIGYDVRRKSQCRVCRQDTLRAFEVTGSGANPASPTKSCRELALGVIQLDGKGAARRK